MSWSEGVQYEIDKTLASQDVSEVVSSAVSGIVEGKIDALLISLGHSVGCDPKRTIDYNQRLLCAAIDELKD